MSGKWAEMNSKAAKTAVIQAAAERSTPGMRSIASSAAVPLGVFEAMSTALTME